MVAIGIVNKIERILVRSAQVQFDRRATSRVLVAPRVTSPQARRSSVAVVGQLEGSAAGFLWIDTRIVARKTSSPGACVDRTTYSDLRNGVLFVHRPSPESRAASRDRAARSRAVRKYVLIFRVRAQRSARSAAAGTSQAQSRSRLGTPNHLRSGPPLEPHPVSAQPRPSEVEVTPRHLRGASLHRSRRAHA
jgi:hypothetical protein